jgi:nitroreductase/heme-degrading monooxygenase HmoA
MILPTELRRKGEPAMVMRITWGKLRPGSWNEFERAYRDHVVANSKDLPGLRGRWLTQDSTDTDTGFTVSLWESEASMQAYEQSLAYKEMMRPLQPFFLGEYRTHRCEVKYDARAAEATFDLDRTVIARHSTRKFLPLPVPRALVDEALALAQHAPSNSNIQPWRLMCAVGAARDRLKDALLEAASHEAPHIPPLPKAFEHYRWELGAEVYGSMGITLKDEDKPRHRAAVMRNFEFFGAPLVAVVCMHHDLGPADALSVGMYLQTLVLELTARGLGTIVEVSVAGYPDVVRAQLNIPPELTIICSLAIGYSDPDFPTNELHIKREPVEKNVLFLDD